MTGFGKTTCEVRNKKITVEIKSLNSKQLDLFSRLPNVYKEKDLELRNVVAQKLERGKIEFSIYSESLGGESTSQMNFSIIESYYKQITEMSQRLGIEPPSDWFSLLLRLPESMKVEVQELDDEEWSVIRKSFDEAVDSLIEFRKKEGESLRAVFMEKLANIRELLSQVDPFEKERVEKIKQRIQEQLIALKDIDYVGFYVARKRLVENKLADFDFKKVKHQGDTLFKIERTK